MLCHAKQGAENPSTRLLSRGLIHAALSLPSAGAGTGQIMLHKRYEYRGVIVGMDAVCQADERWQRVRSQSLSARATMSVPDPLLRG